MSSINILGSLQKASKARKKLFAVLIDPEACNLVHLEQIAKLSEAAAVDFFLVGGSLLLNEALDDSLSKLKEVTDKPLVLFPGNSLQVSSKADAILLLSLISGRNPDLLIGQHVIAAPEIARANLEVIPTGYMLIDGGQQTSVQYMSNTMPIPNNKPEIAACTALAGQQLGLQTIYLDAGSGAKVTVPTDMIKKVKEFIDVPIICGGGIRNADEVYQKGKAGADIIVVGNAIEKDPSLIMEMNLALQETTA